MNNEQQLFNILNMPAELVKYLPIRIVLRKSEDGTLKGLVEHSFAMDVATGGVRIWWSGKAYSMLGEHHINGIDDAKYNAKAGDLIIDPLTEDCPVEIDWESWLTATDKYNQRNARFKIKGGVK